MMASLPSYQEATTRPHWLSLVAPYARPRDYARLCLVDKRFYAEFAPRIWKDPFKTIRLLGHDPADDTNRLRHFLTRHVDKMRLATRSLVLSLDLGVLDLASYQFFDDQLWNGANPKEASSRVASAFPSLRCILLGRAPPWLVDSLMSDLEKDPGPSTGFACLMLAAPKAATILRPAFFLSPNIRRVVYLDLSYAPGSLRSTLLSASWPCLRILNIQGREMDDATALALFAVSRRQLWSLDISHNKLTDAILDAMVQSSFPEASLRTAAQYDVEGKLKWTDSAGSPWYGRFGFIDESGPSSQFNHPARHLADPPVYTRDSEGEPEGQRTNRHNGRRPLRRDSPVAIKHVFVGRPDQLPGTHEDIARHDVCASHGGVTHLRLNGNAFSLHGIERMIRESPGQIEHLECDTTRLEVPIWTSEEALPRWLAAARLTGFVGAAHLLRPVFCPHLQALRVHHSLVTQTPAVQEETLTAGDSLWVAEAFFEPRVAMAFPQVFEPDMNPRLYSLTLTDVPRYSTGPLIAKVLNLLRQASSQERAIQDINAAHSLRASASLRGLRHVHLEFGQDPREAAPSDLDDVDAAQLLGPADEEFSFFGQSGWASSSSATRNGQLANADQGHDDRPSHDETPLFASGTPPPYRPGNAATPEQRESHHGDWNGRVFTVPVWVSSGIPGLPHHPAVDEYVRLIQYPELRARAGPASPSQVLAGVPAGSYLYHAAWDAIMAPPMVRKPTAVELGGMRDVVAAIKEYRGKTKAALSAVQKAAGTTDVPMGEPHYHWGGKLEISFPSVSHDPGMWR